MANHHHTFSIQSMRQVLGISRAGFYAWRTRAESQRCRADKRLLVLIKTSFKKVEKRIVIAVCIMIYKRKESAVEFSH